MKKYQSAIDDFTTQSFLQNTLSEVNFPAPGGCT